MAKILQSSFFMILLSLINIISCSYEIREMILDDVKRGSLTDNEYDYFKLTLPAEIDKDGQIVIELEPDPSLDDVNNIVSDPNLYISLDEPHPTTTVHTWSSNRFGDETISIGVLI